MRILCYVVACLVILLSLLLFIIGKINLLNLPHDESIITYNSYKLNKDYDLWLTAQKIYNKYLVKSSYFLVPFTIIISFVCLTFIKDNFTLLWSINGLLILICFAISIVKSRTNKDIDNLIASKR